MRTIAIVASAAFLLALACAKEPSTGVHKTFHVAVIPKGTSHEFGKSVEKGAKRADAELDALEVVWKGPTGEGDAAQEIQLVESFVADRVDGICVAPLDARALETPVKQAIASGIPVVVFDSGLA